VSGVENEIASKVYKMYELKKETLNEKIVIFALILS